MYVRECALNSVYSNMLMSNKLALNQTSIGYRFVGAAQSCLYPVNRTNLLLIIVENSSFQVFFFSFRVIRENLENLQIASSYFNSSFFMHNFLSISTKIKKNIKPQDSYVISSLERHRIEFRTIQHN